MLRMLLSAVLRYFNPRSDERSDRSRSALPVPFLTISIHAPTNGATYELVHVDVVQRISIHAPTNGATDGLHRSAEHAGISIHAPTNGATHGLLGLSFFRRISIHAPTNGATISNRYFLTLCLFQSTLRRTERH